MSRLVPSASAATEQKILFHFKNRKRKFSSDHNAKDETKMTRCRKSNEPNTQPGKECIWPNAPVRDERKWNQRKKNPNSGCNYSITAFICMLEIYLTPDENNIYKRHICSFIYAFLGFCCWWSGVFFSVSTIWIISKVILCEVLDLMSQVEFEHKKREIERTPTLQKQGSGNLKEFLDKCGEHMFTCLLSVDGVPQGQRVIC